MEMIGDKEVVVFSRTLRAAAHPGITVVSTDPAETVRGLKSNPGKDIWLFSEGASCFEHWWMPGWSTRSKWL
jgi:dihydrofolate reductase